MSGIQIDNISHDWGEKRALDAVSFDVAPGRFCALLGPNGAGKSTLFALLSGLIAPRQGRIALAGHDMAVAPRAALAKIGVVFQQQTLDLDLSVWRNMLYFAGLQGLSARHARRAATAALEQLGMLDRSAEKVRNLNGGHRRRLEIARALMHEPEVLLLDEPTVGLDAATRNDIVKYVHSLTKTTKISVLWATHLTDEVFEGDHLVVVHKGRIISNDLADCTGSALTDRFLAMTSDEVIA